MKLFRGFDLKKPRHLNAEQ